MSDLSGENIRRAAPHLEWRWRARTGQGKRISGSTGTTDKAKAEKFAKAKLKELSGEIAILKQEAVEDRSLGLKRLTFAAACEKWLAYADEEGLAETGLKAQVEWLYDPKGGGIPASIQLENIDRDMISTLRSRRINTVRRAKGGGWQKVSKATVNKTLRLLQRILNRAADAHDGKVRRFKWGNFFFETTKVKKVRAISPAVQGLIIDTLGVDYEPLVCFAAVTGLRAQECLAGWAQYDPAEKMLLNVSGKGHRADGGRDVPLGSAALAILNREQSRNNRDRDFIFTRIAKKTGTIPRTDRKQIAGMRYPMTFTCWSSAWDRMRDKLRGTIPGVDIDAVRIHDLRHTAATRALQAGMSITMVQDMLGHSTPVITKAIYAHHDRDDIRRAQDAAAARAEIVTNRPRSSTG